MELKKFFLDLFFPISCIGCNHPEVLICPECFRQIKINPSVMGENYRGRYLDGVWSATDFSDVLVQKIIHNYKYRFVKDLSEVTGALLNCYLDQLILAGAWPTVELVMPVPLTVKRQLRRGFNQSALVAGTVSQKLDLALVTDVLLRKRQNTQVGLTARQRQYNIKDAFVVIDPAAVKNKTILLIDDVVTTGSTLDECGRVLKLAGAKKVLALTIARK